MASSKTSTYTTDHSSSVLQTHGWRTATNSAAYLVPHIKPNMNILDVGCGPGSITIDFAALVPEGHVTGIEYVSDPLDQARSLASSRGINNVTFDVADIHSLPFPDDSFDIVHAHQVLQHIADPVQGLQEMRRVVKPGGLVACRESAALTWYPPSKGIQAWKDLTEGMGVAKGGNPHPGNHIHVWAEEAGFMDITKSAGSWCFSTDAERRYWGGSMGDRMKDSGLRKMAIEEGYASADDLDLIEKGWREFQENSQAWFGLLHGEMLCKK